MIAYRFELQTLAVGYELSEVCRNTSQLKHFWMLTAGRWGSFEGRLKSMPDAQSTE